MPPLSSDPTARPLRLSDVRAYLRAPRYTQQREALSAGALIHLLLLVGATILGIFVLTPLLGGIVIGVMGELPDNSIANIDTGTLLLLGVVIAPLWEELAYRSWLGGPRSVLIGLPVLAAVSAGLTAVGSPLGSFATLVMMAVLGVLIFQLVLRVFAADEASLYALRRRAFPFVFWGSALLFGMLHLANYDGGLSHPVLLLAVVPQFLVGAVLGYVRMRFGLLAAIGFHAAYNGVLIGLMLVLAGIAPEAVENSAAVLHILQPCEASVPC